MATTAPRLLLLFLAALVCVAGAGRRGASAADWPQFRGPNRDGVSPETGLLKAWPEGGPPRVLTLTGLGEGFSSPVIADGKVFASGERSEYLFVFCFDLQGKPLWHTPCGEAYTKSYRGSRGTPTVAAGRVYVLSGVGLLTVLDAATGRRLWSVDVLERFRADGPRYGTAESVLVEQGRVICTPGGKEGTLAALDADTGRTVWTSRGLDDRAGHASPIAVTWGGERQVITLTNKGLVGVRLADGTPLWRHTKGFGGFFHEHVLTPVFHDGLVFAEGGHRAGGACVRLVPKGDAVEAEHLWSKSASSTHTGGYVECDGCLFGDSGKGWACIDMTTGEVLWTEAAIRGAATIWADGRFYCVGEKGTVYLVQAGRDGASTVGSFRMPNPGSETWAYPAIAGGRLYVRRKGEIHVYDVAAPSAQAEPAPGPK